MIVSKMLTAFPLRDTVALEEANLPPSLPGKPLQFVSFE